MIRIKTWFTSNLSALILAAIVAGVVLRISGITDSSIWYDEAFSVYLTRLPLIGMVQAAGSDFNPPLWELVLWPLVKLFGDSELIIRLPALAFSLASFWLAWRLTIEIKFSQVQTLAAMVLIAFMPIQLWMAQDARCYSLLSALFLGAVWFAMRQRWLGLLACCGLMLYTHATGIFYAATAIAIGYWISLAVTQPVIDQATKSRLLSLPKNKMIWAGAGAVISFLPWVPFYLHASNLSFWANPLTVGSFLFSVLASWWVGSLSFAAFLLLFVILLSVCLLSAIVFTLEPVQDHTFKTSPLPIMVMAAIGPFVMLLFASLFYKNLILYRTLGLMVIPLCIWIAGTVTPRRLTRTTWIIPYTWIFLLLAGLSAWSPAARGGDLREEAQFINSQLSTGDVIFHVTGTTALPFDYYMPGAADQSYILDVQQDDGLLQTDLQKTFGLHRAMLESIPYQRAWIIWAKDTNESIYAQNRMAAITQGATLIGVIHGWQFSDIEIYLKEN